MAIMYIKWKCKTDQSASWASNCLWPFIQPSFNVQYSIIFVLFLYLLYMYLYLYFPFHNYLLVTVIMGNSIYAICWNHLKCTLSVIMFLNVCFIYQCYLLRNDQSLLVMFGTRMLFCRFLFVKWCETDGILPPFKVLC